ARRSRGVPGGVTGVGGDVFGFGVPAALFAALAARRGDVHAGVGVAAVAVAVVHGQGGRGRDLDLAEFVFVHDDAVLGLQLGDVRVEGLGALLAVHDVLDLVLH